MDWLSHFVLLFPSGAVALAERTLLFQATLFMLIVAVPVFILIFFFAWYYRAGNTKAKYTPDWAHSKMEELIWWAIPLEIILILGALTWTSTHELDPRRALSSEPPLVVQVIALDDKWLFIYPEENIATVNYVAMPVDKPVEFKVTADAPMNSFWIPALGGQIYAMTGMVNELNLVANKAGKFDGRSANYSGVGFAKMKFIAEAMPEAEFEQWMLGLRTSSLYLDAQEYSQMKEREISAPVLYSGVDPQLFDAIVMKFMGHTAETHTHE
jgi:cytochrome o ubiquinol oxidase subunit II